MEKDGWELSILVRAEAATGLLFKLLVLTGNWCTGYTKHVADLCPLHGSDLRNIKRYINGDYLVRMPSRYFVKSGAI